MDGEKLLNVLDTMRLSNGAYTASRSKDYDYVWIRDVCYTVIPYLTSSCGRYEEAYYALFDLLKRYEWKIDIHTKQKPEYLYEHIHARYSKNLTEIHVEWGHAQHDAIGIFLWGVGEGVRHGKKMIRDQKDLEIVQKLVYYLECVQYWQDEDNGMWEENLELHASSVGACVAGLKAVKMLVVVPQHIIRKGEETLRFLLPRESQTKDADLALLSLIYPYHVVSRKTAQQILNRVTTKLERKYGCIRYENDQYYNNGSEAEWCFGFPWLGLCYSELGTNDKVLEYWKKTEQILPENGEVPELYIGGTDKPNGNTPLAWAVAMTYLLHERVQDLEFSVS
ncbi:glycoside hydrolase family 15 protein [Bacillus taeanensis]|uniref:Glycoside hydrolase family 15 n=1 Tax=Bacillus taeanensis TaxID=273032 RepID=A0A366XYZ0_9BACI|nr:glycoside hydrolase family 15 protein [Bacillus taeanensis]RBW71372.1 glycoside hydrolase family 15 [Bacillus taeanensis]